MRSRSGRARTTSRPVASHVRYRAPLVEAAANAIRREFEMSLMAKIERIGLSEDELENLYTRLALQAAQVTFATTPLAREGEIPIPRASYDQHLRHIAQLIDLSFDLDDPADVDLREARDRLQLLIEANRAACEPILEPGRCGVPGCTGAEADERHTEPF